MKNNISWVGNIWLLFLNYDGNLQLLYIQIEMFPTEKFSSVILNECIEILYIKRVVNGLFFSAFVKDVCLYLGVIGKLHGDECQINILTGNVLYGIQKIFTYCSMNVGKKNCGIGSQ